MPGLAAAAAFLNNQDAKARSFDSLRLGTLAVPSYPRNPRFRLHQKGFHGVGIVRNPKCRMIKKLLLVIVLWLPVVLLVHAREPKEPKYEGKPLSYWLEDRNLRIRALLSSDVGAPPFLTAEQESAVKHIGTRAVPFLVRWISDFDQTNDYPDFGPIIQAFHVLGPSANSAIPELVFVITNASEISPDGSGVRVFANCQLDALAAIGKGALPSLLNILTNCQSPNRRLATMWSIARMGTNALPALPVLMRFVNDTNNMVALETVKAVAQVGAGTREGLADLREIMKLPGRFHRDYRYAALDEMGKYGKASLPDVIAALDTENFWRAYLLLTAVAPEALTNHMVLQYAAKRLHSNDAGDRDNAALLLQSASQLVRGEKPDSFGQLNMEPVYREATNTLRLLAPELLKDDGDSQVPH
jgi:hypothetical protein